MKTPLRFDLIATAFLSLFAPTAQAVDIFAEYSPGAPPYSAALEIGNPSFLRGQAFTATTSGNLTHVDVFVMRDVSSSATDPLIVELRAGIHPAGPILAAGSIVHSAVPAGDPGTGSGAAFVGVELTPVSIVADGTYSVWLRTAGTSNLYSWWGRTGNPDADGAALTNSTVLFEEDLGFHAIGTFTPTGPRAGVLDTSFGSGGKVTTDFADTDEGGSSVAIQNDGKIIVAGTRNLNVSVFAVARFTSMGALDSSFATGGKVSTQIGSFAAVARSVALQSDGQIVVAGNSYGGTSTDIALARYTSAGALDTSFGSGGTVITDVNNRHDEAYGVALQSDGKIVVAGTASSGNDRGFSIHRYTNTGASDTSFGSGGGVYTDFSVNWDTAHSVAIQSDGKIVAAGHADSGAVFALARYTTTGSLDTGFGNGGKVTTNIRGGSNDEAYGMVLQSDGKIVVAGKTFNGNDSDIVVVRYTSTGALDTTFGIGGIVTTPVLGSSEYGLSVALQSDGKIVVAGYSESEQQYDFAVVRYTSDGAVDMRFGSGGIVTTDFGSSSDSGSSVALQMDGKIVVAGSAHVGTTHDFALVRYDRDPMAPAVALGTPDNVQNNSARITFTVNPNGSATTWFVEYGTTTAYGQQSVTQNIPAGGIPVSLHQVLTSLSSGTLYHYRVVATNTVGTTTTGDGTFSTAWRGAFALLHSMSDVAGDGRHPIVGVREGPGGFLYGANYESGTGGPGTLFKISKGGVFTKLYSIPHGDPIGANPLTPLLPGSDGNLYGTTTNGGTNAYGAFFRMTPAGTVTALFAYTQVEGTHPSGTNATDGAGNFFGVTDAGGADNFGTIYKINLNGGLVLINSFNGGWNGQRPTGVVYHPSNGTLYFTTLAGGAQGEGVFGRMSGTGVSAGFVVLHDFDDPTGKNPVSAPTLASDGNFYGTCTGGGPNDGGAVYKMTPEGDYTPLHYFVGADGELPTGTPAEGDDGKIYGTCYWGGTNGMGTIWRIAKDGSGFEVLHRFSGADGEGPEFGDVIKASDGNLYGTTALGGANGTGTVWAYRFDPDISLERPANQVLVDGTASIDFGAVLMGTPVLTTFTIRNTGARPLTGITVTIGGTHASEFFDTSMPAVSLAPGATTTFDVRFTPTGFGARNASLQVASNDPDENPFDIQLTGQGLTATQNWTQTYFGTTGSTGNAAPGADPNDNGISNLLEYALGGDPVGAATGLEILPDTAIDPTSHCLVFSLTRYVDRNDITLTVQAADSPNGPWANLARSINGASFAALLPGVALSETGSGPSRSVAVCDIYQIADPAQPSRMMRLLVEQQ